MTYRLLLSPKSKRFLGKLDSQEKERVEKKLRNLKQHPELGKPMLAKLAGLCSLRMGKHRALYQIRQNERAVLVLRIAHRRKVY